MAGGTLDAEAGVVNIVGTRIQHASWSVDAVGIKIIPFAFYGYEITAITNWSYFTIVIDLIHWGVEFVAKDSYPFVTQIEPFLFGHEVIAGASYISPAMIVIPIDLQIEEGRFVLDIQIIKYGSGIPAWQFWG